MEHTLNDRIIKCGGACQAYLCRHLPATEHGSCYITPHQRQQQQHECSWEEHRQLCISLYGLHCGLPLPPFISSPSSSFRIPQSRGRLPLSSPFRQTICLFLSRSTERTIKWHDFTIPPCLWSDLNNLLAFNGFLRLRDTRMCALKRRRRKGWDECFAL